MALHFHGNQFEQAYKPRVLRNWEVPKRYNDKPRRRTGRTEIISNERGHLLPGVPKSKESPWGNYVGTWHMPKKIDRETANRLNGTVKKQTCEEKRKALQKLEQIKEEAVVEEKATEEPKPEAETPEEKKPEIVEQTEKTTEKIVEEKARDDKENACPYVPGDFTEEKDRPPSHDLLAQNRYDNHKPSSNGYPRYREDFSKLPEQPTEKIISRDAVEAEYQNHKKMAQQVYSPSNGVNGGGRKNKPPTPILAAIKNFQLAKRLHRENLEHDPLPDTITNSKYRKLQMQRSDKDPGLALKDDNYATGIGWKGYPGYGPTRCTKLKVYRPKTCGHKEEVKNDGRPSSVTSFDKRWRFIRRRKVSPIELAICWDLTPENPQDEPKRPTHIDGSNGSMAPAVFSLVHSPKEEEEEESRKSSIGTDPGPVFEKGPPIDPQDRDFVLDRPKTSVSQEKRRTSRDSSQSGESLSKKRAKSAYNLNGGNNHEREERRSRCSHCSNEEGLHQSTPNLSDHANGKNHHKNTRMCMACEMKNISLKDNNRPDKNEFKMAFKAGVPQTNKRKDKRQDYPEHWRLATVYQHSYKPIHTRKRPLLATVFK